MALKTYINHDAFQLSLLPIGEPFVRPSYHLQSDNDGHWYVIQDGKEEEFEKWVEAMENGYDWSGDNFDSYAVGGSPSSVHFPEYWIG